MADVIRYVHPSEQIKYTVDFQDLLPSGDSAVSAIDSGSSISATKTDGTDADANLFSKTQSGKTLAVTLKNLLEGEDYLVTFVGEGATSKQRFVRVVSFRVRSGLTDEF